MGRWVSLARIFIGLEHASGLGGIRFPRRILPTRTTDQEIDNPENSLALVLLPNFNFNLTCSTELKDMFLSAVRTAENFRNAGRRQRR